MLAPALILVLAGAPTPDELPHWSEAPQAPEPSEPPKAKVPSDGSGSIALGSLLLVSGGVAAITAVVLAAEPDLSPTSSPGLPAMAAGVQLATGTVFLTLGLVIRRQFRSKPAIPGAPRTGGGMLLGGLGLMVGGTAYAAHALVDMTTEICVADAAECQAIRPIGSRVELGFALASMAVGTGLFAVGVRRRVGYLRWEEQRLRLQPAISFSPGSLQLGITGQF